jgi:SAM-dependent methyltransferase
VLAASAHQRAGHDGWVVGLDPNEPMLTVARSRPSPVEWRSGAAEDIPYADGAFDRVVSQFALMYFADRSRGLAECARVTAPGGRVAIATWATLEDSPGYAALVDVAERTVGAEAVAALSAPFCLGDPAEVHALVAGAYADVEVRRHHGTARFASVDSLLYAEMRGWTLASAIDDAQYAELLAAARSDLARFTDRTGRVEFAMPALVATAHRPDDAS